MSHGRRHKRRKGKNKIQVPREALEKPSTTPPINVSVHKTDWFGIVFPILVTFGMTFLIINADSPLVLISAWAVVALATTWLFLRLLKPFAWVWWKKGIPFGLVLCGLFVFGFWNIRERLRPSFVLITPGPLLNGTTWDLIVNHRGPKTSYNVQILFIDEDRIEYLQRTTQVLTPQDLNSYQFLVSLPEVNPKGRGTIFAKQFQWKPFSLGNSHFTIEATWRDGATHQEMYIAQVQDKWKFAITLSDKETGKVLLNCKDDGFPSPGTLPNCFPGIIATD